MRRITNKLTNLMIRRRKKYCGWCGATYSFYREVLKHSKFKAWKGSFTMPSKAPKYKEKEIRDDPPITIECCAEKDLYQAKKWKIPVVIIKEDITLQKEFVFDWDCTITSKPAPVFFSMGDTNKISYYDIDEEFHAFPYCWTCPCCNKEYKLRDTEDFKCDCGQALKFRFYRLKKEFL